ncbi:prophage P2b protein 20 [Lactiplantibacillus plantarum]|nr:prophage P2b protein 20 [Lactiplantibacillus plantarum]
MIPMRQDVQKICNLLKQYAKLKRDLTAYNQVSSPSFDGVPSHSSQNGTETCLINHVDLSYQLKEVEDALNAINDPQYQFILHDYIIEKRFSRNEACQRLSVSVSKFNYMKNEALHAFAKFYSDLTV